MSHRLASASASVSVVVVVANVAGCTVQAAETAEDRDTSDRTDTANVGVSTAELNVSPLQVSFNGCSELASITTISVAQARTVVPISFALAGDASGAPFVVRVAECSAVSVGGSSPEAGTVAQLGVSVVSPDGTGDINNYAAWYYTTSAPLALGLRMRGVPAQWVPRLSYERAGGRLTIDVNHPGHPAFHVDAALVEPGPGAIAFHANWWVQNGPFRSKMSTPIPAISFGGATATLTTARVGQLGRLLESSTATFALLDSFNRFPTAPMTVSVSRL